MNRQLRPFLLVCALGSAALGCAPPMPVLKMGGDFELTDDHGARFALKQERGKVVLLFFGFAHCPDFCPTTLAKVRRALEMLKHDQKKQVRMLMITVDPERDTPERLREYMGRYQMGATGLTGTVADIERVAKQYGAMFQKSGAQTAAGYMVDHSPYVYLIDQEGRVRHYFRFRDEPEEFAARIKRLL